MRSVAPPPGAVRSPQLPGGSVPAARPTSGRMFDTIEGGEERERLAVTRADLHVLTETTTVSTGAAGSRPKLAAPEDQRRRRFDDFHRGSTNDARESGRREPIEAGSGAGASRRDNRDHVVTIGGAAAHRERPERGRALGWDAARHELIEASEHDVREQAAHDVTARKRLGPLRGQDASLGH